LEDLLATTEPLEEYLANAGCLRPLRRLEDKNLLVDDILMFQVIHRVRGPFERYILPSVFCLSNKELKPMKIALCSGFSVGHFC